MEEVEIKHEFDKSEQLQCRACLSIGRSLVPLGKYGDIYRKLILENLCQNTNGEEYLICWECKAVLHKIDEFRNRVAKANDIMQLGQNYIYGTLSSLTTLILNDTNPHTVYINNNTTNIQTNAKTRTNDFVSNNEEENNDQKQTNEFNDLLKDNDLQENYFLQNNDIADNDSVNDIQLQLGIKEDVKNVLKVNKKKLKNRWAKKRALLNKKPKFKIIIHNDINMDSVFHKMTETEIYTNAMNKRDYEYQNSKYKCEKCVTGFHNEELISKHNRKWHGKIKNPFICAICNKYFKSKTHISRHLHKHNDNYKCLLCDNIGVEKDRRSHLEERHNKLLKCLKCGLMFGTRKDFFAHFKEWHEKYTCDYCGISFKMRYCIKDHIRKQHSPFECKQCKKRFARYSGLWLHNKTNHSDNTQTAYCVECNKEYADIYRYRWHLANSTRHRPRKKIRIPCPGCDKIFSKNIYMKDHYNLVHLKVYNYRCEECDKNFIRNADLARHRRKVHDRIPAPKNKICYMCGRGFSTNKILTNHLRTHTGERPHACTQCGARFAQSTALLGHIRALHQNRVQTET